ncbi:MAG TPA: acyl-CoA synthetase [Syntrophus sp. (in: bacteria)]|nr:acyl-CoA synthetase [Syntrophus sp. (in: bacteria)]
MEITFLELDRLSDRFAAALTDLGVVKGDRVAIHLPNCPQFAIAYYGLLKCGAIFVPLSPLLSERELKMQMNDAGTETFIGLNLLYAAPQKVLPETPVKRVILTDMADCYPPLSAPAKPLPRFPIPEGALDFTTLIARYPAQAPEVVIDPKADLAHIAYTGGTTGTPKGVMITHYKGVVSCCQMNQYFVGGDVTYENGILGLKRMAGDREEDHAFGIGVETSLVVAPWFHVMGIYGYLNQPFMKGSTLVVFPRFDLEEFMKAIPKYRPAVFGGAPQLFVPMVAHPLFQEMDLSVIKLIVSGAAPISLTLLEKLRAKIPGIICEAYGLSEATCVATISPPTRDGLRLGSVGLPIADVEIKIVDPENDRIELPLGETGEICLKGPQIMSGYWKRPEETAEVLKDGWLLTGDIGRVDEDGYLFIVDRKKDMLLCKGHNVYPRDLEEVLNAHPDVMQSAVVGKKDERYGEAPVAFVQLRPGARATEAELLTYVNENIALYKKIRRLVITDQLPANMAGKILRRELRDQVQAPDFVV